MAERNLDRRRGAEERSPALRSKSVRSLTSDNDETEFPVDTSMPIYDDLSLLETFDLKKKNMSN